MSPAKNDARNKLSQFSWIHFGFFYSEQKKAQNLREKHKKLKPCKSAAHNSTPNLVIPIVTCSPRVFKSAYRVSSVDTLTIAEKLATRCLRASKARKFIGF